MASDIDMDAPRPSRTPDFPFPPPSVSASAATSRRSSLAVANEVKGIAVTNGHDRGGTSSQGPISIPVLVHSPSPAPSTEAAPPASSVVPPTTAPAKPLSSSNKAPSTAKPKSTKPTKARSPSPSPPPPPIIPLSTIRLEIRLGGPSNYEVDISQQAKDTGQRPPTPPPAPKKVADSSESEEEEDDKAKDDKSKPKKKKRKNHASEYYDTSDPFIDDSELALDERQFFAQTKQQGFYVSSGEVALLKDKTPKKPKSKKVIYGLHPSLGGTGAGTEKKDLSTEGTRDAPIPVEDDNKKPNLSLTIAAGADPEHAGQKRKRQNTIVGENGKRKKVVDESMFHPDLQAAIQELKKLIAQESWAVKGKFPAGLKPPLAKIAILAIRLDEYDEDFFSLMPTLFPYNKFTMTKLIKRTVYPDHLALLHERENTLMAQLTELAQKGFAKAEEEWEKSVIAWGQTAGEDAD
ncbi:hypothetical protein NLJ89_g6624 [Agrocybe chaxingu]|uniref:Ubinuclein middle domain-containing protein n=1 Tax=Agrocybe chaxingu TaxID=84603 RepID=A0A9W8K572_9AGAR|nr:hypothetical protein NLJ89_g6624 [Agrocybe chaxingu]